MAVDALSTANKYALGRQLCAGAIEDVADIEAGDQFAVAVDVVLRQIGEKTTATTHHFQEAASRVVIMRVGSEMRSKVVDTCGEDGDLYFRRACVCTMYLVLANYFLLALLQQCQR